MTNTQTVRIDLTSPGGFAPVIHAVAGDIYSRFVRMELYQGGVLYEPPSGTTCTIGWRRQNGDSGAYNSILEEDGSSSHPAWELEDNVLTIELDWHVCQHPGDVAVNVSLNGEGGSRLHTWELCCRVARGAVADADDPTKPSESATEAANRAEKAAAEAEAAAERSEAVADELENIVKDGPVVSVNGKTGRVQLSASDIPFDNAGTPFVSTTVQDAIEELLDIGGGGGTASSTITVTAPAGSVVTVSKGDKGYTQTVGEDGAALSFKVFETGEWTVSAVLNGEVDKRTVNVAEAGGSYSVELPFSSFEAYIKVTTADGATVKASKGDSVVTDTAAGGIVTLTVSEAGQWTVSATYKDGVAQSATVYVGNDGQTYTAEAKFCTLTVTAPAGSSVEIKNADTTLTGTADSGSIKFWLPNTGTWTVTASLSGQQASDSVECAAYQGYNLTLSYISATLGDNDWATIREVSEAGQADNWWDVGDGKQVTLNGTVGILNLSALAVMAYIVGFNHNASREGDNLTHFKLGKISNTQIAFRDSQYANDNSSTAFRMNTLNTNAGGWQASYMRSTILGDGGTPSSPAANSLMAALPEDLRAVIRTANKYTYNSGGVTATADYLSLMAEFEIFGAIEYANPQEQSYQVQYAYYQAGNPKIHYCHDSTGYAVAVWLRSRSLSDSFCAVNTNGAAGTSYANYSVGLAPLFYV